MRASVPQEPLVFRFFRAEPACIRATTSGSRLGSLHELPASLILGALPGAPSFSARRRTAWRVDEQRADQRTKGSMSSKLSQAAVDPLDRVALGIDGCRVGRRSRENHAPSGRRSLERLERIVQLSRRVPRRAYVRRMPGHVRKARRPRPPSPSPFGPADCSSVPASPSAPRRGVG